MTPEQQYHQAMEAGRSARRAGRKRESRPMYALGQLGQPQRDAWDEGYDSEDEEIRAQRKRAA